MSQSKTSFVCASLLGILLAGQTNAAWGAVVTVCPAGCDQTSVQAGINVAMSGDTVLVGTPDRSAPETYQEYIQMKDGVSVVSQGTDTLTTYTDPFGKTTENTKHVLTRATLTILHGFGNDSVVSFPAGTNAVLDGFTIENIDETADDYTALIRVGDSSPTIQNNIVRDNQGPGHNGGISIRGGVDVATPLIQNNVIHYVNGCGIGVRSKGYPTIIDNEIFTTPPVINPTPPKGKPFREAPGIGFQEDSAATILNNHIFLNGAGGISSRGPEEPDGSILGGVYNLPGYAFDIRGNDIHDNKSAAGIYIMGKAGEEFPTAEVDCTIGGPNLSDRNTICNNYEGVNIGFWNNNISKSLGSALVQNNNIHDNRQPGMTVNHTTVAEIKGNTLTANKKVGIHVNRNEDLTIESNTITGNGQAWTSQGAGIWLQNNSLDHTVLVQNNQISGSVAGGIRVGGYFLNAVIKNNEITGNGYGGIRIQGVTELDIINNEIAYNGRGGIHTGNDKEDGGFMFVPDGSFTVTIRGNKVHHNGQGVYGGGIDVRHAAGTIENNLVYKNNTGGIRWSDWINAINHNTVVNNGLSDVGGGIIYDNLAGAVTDPPAGFPPAAIPIRNNVLVANTDAGVNAGTLNGGSCDDWVGFRDYNLLSSNNDAAESCAGEPWCERPQLASCAGNPDEIFAAPLFVDADSDDYHLQYSSLPEDISPAVDAGDPLFPVDVQPPGLGDLRADMGAYGGEYGINW